VWRNGQLTVLWVPDTFDVVATRINASGDVLLQYPPSFAVPGASWGHHTAVRVLRADGMLLGVGPMRTLFRPDEPNAGGLSCCDTAGDLNDRRQALGYVRSGSIYDVTLRLDVAGGAVDTTLAASYDLINNAGQRAGTRPSPLETVVRVDGFALPPLPPGPRAIDRCSGASRGTHTEAVDLDDGANLLVRSECWTFSYRSAAGSVWLDRHLPAPRARTAPGDDPGIHLSRQGGVVAVVDSGGQVYLWNAATRRTERVEVATAPYVLDGLGAVNAAGQIVVHGTDAATKRGAAFLLTPAR
jgi:hypothetical protein